MTEATKLENPKNTQIALWSGIAVSALFTLLIWLANPLLDRFVLDPGDGTGAFYDWQLLSPSAWSRATAWGLYAIHQVALWSLIYYAQTRVKTYSKGLHPVNVWAFGINAFFIVVHLIQTHLWYDGLAQDVSSFTSQGSVVLMLCAILVMENKRRGMFFGAKAPLSERVVAFARKYHGYLFSWAIVYTFWFHPMVSTPGHLAGFFYMFLLMMQSSLFLTRLHVNKYWTIVQEVMVLIHGTMVAVYQGNDLWRMFGFGFAGMFVITQMHGLKLSKLTRWIIAAVYVLAVLFAYNGDWAQLNQIIRIPIIEYLVAFILAGLVALGLWIAGRFKKTDTPSQSLHSGTGDD